MSTKRSINKKEVRAITQKELEAGKSREEILDELSERYFDRKTLAGCVADVPDPYLKEKYGTANTILFLLLIATAFGKILMVITLLERSLLFLLLVPIVVVLNVWLAIGVKNMRGHIYWITTILAFLGIWQTIKQLDSPGPELFIELALLVFIAALSWYVAAKMFPHLRFGKPVGWAR